VAVSVCFLGIGFYFNVVRKPSRMSQAIFWIATAFTLATIVHWGWWKF
jgi:hypothetical protein